MKRIAKWNIPSFLRHEHIITIDLGLNNDSAGFSVFHAERLVLPQGASSVNFIQDAVTAWEPDPKKKLIVSFPNIEEIIKQISARIIVKGVYFDQWNSAQMVQNLRAASINSETYRLDLQDYKNFKEQIYFQRISLLNYPKQITEIKALELIKGLKVDHPDTGSKDVADTAVGAVKVLIQPLGLLGFDEGEYVSENLSASDDEGETVSMSLDTGEGVRAKFHAGKTVGV